MVLSNAERQARWRSRRNELAKAGAKADPERLDVLLEQLEVLMVDLDAEGQKNMATMSPATVATLAGRLEMLVEAMRAGAEIPEPYRRQRREDPKTRRKVRTLLERRRKWREQHPMLRNEDVNAN